MSICVASRETIEAGTRQGFAMVGPTSKPRVAYLHDPEVGQFYYGPSHPMKPHRMQLAHQLILGYELHHKMACYTPHKASVPPHSLLCRLAKDTTSGYE